MRNKQNNTHIWRLCCAQRLYVRIILHSNFLNKWLLLSRLHLRHHGVHDHVVAHHGHIFMFQDVAMVHIHAGVRPEGHGDLDPLARPDQDGVFPTTVNQALIDGGVTGGAGGDPLDDLEHDVVHVHGMWDG